VSTPIFELFIDLIQYEGDGPFVAEVAKEVVSIVEYVPDASVFSLVAVAYFVVFALDS